MNRQTSGFEQVLTYLEEELQFESGVYNDSYLDRRITARIRRVDADDYSRYLRVLRADEAERDALLESLSINVTEFFRNPDMWEGIRPVLRELTAEGTARAWSAPCSDGREPYSMSMLAMDDDEIDERNLSVLGTDIDREALAHARAGEYQTTRIKDIADELSVLDDFGPYVAREDDHFQVREPVRERVTFERHDLIRDRPKSGFDLAMCRNLLIYIDDAFKRRIVETVIDSLNPGGYLIIGMSETIPRDSREALETVDGRHRIYRKED